MILQETFMDTRPKASYYKYTVLGLWQVGLQTTAPAVGFQLRR